jgi:hypothetical protein
MSRPPARVTQADIRRALKAAKEAGAAAVSVLPDGTIRIELTLDEEPPGLPRRVRDGRSPTEKANAAQTAVAMKLEQRKKSLSSQRRAETDEKIRTRAGFTDEYGNYRKIVAGLRAGQVRVIGPDGRKWIEDAKPTDPAPWQRKRPPKQQS